MIIYRMIYRMVINPENDEDPSLQIESFAIINLRGVSTKLYFNLIFNIKGTHS